MRRPVFVSPFLRFPRHRVQLISLVLVAAFLAAAIESPIADAVAPNFAARQDFATGANPFTWRWAI